MSFSDDYVDETTDNNGNWSKSGLQGEVKIVPQRTGFGQFVTFSPSEYFVDSDEDNIIIYKDKEIFNNNNVAEVSNDPTNETIFTINDTYKINHIRTYHWNNGDGKEPGTISLKDNDTNEIVRSWSAGAWDSNIYWYVEPNIELDPGTYTIIDSDNSTWSHNSESGYKGFAYVGGVFVQ